ncbi:MAG: rhamnulokinase family protein, partial [Lysinibacillus sp.]
MHHLAIDIGASSGRIVHGELENGKIVLNEIHRFPNFFREEHGHCFWNIDYLFEEIVKGLIKAKQNGISECTLGVDTWAVDYVLLDEQGNRLQDVYAYRDVRTEHTMEKVFNILPKETIYKKTGIQFLSFNTLFQLFEESKDVLARCKHILLIPDYLNYLLTGKSTLEITNFSTTQLLNISTRQLDNDLLNIVNLKPSQFPTLIEPGIEIGPLLSSLTKQFDLPNVTVISVASHDTASAVLGTPSISEHWAYLSSGTWSLVGIESNKPFVTDETLHDNYTNEYGAFHTYRFLKNIMGL